MKEIKKGLSAITHGGVAMHSQELKSWKSEQISYFKGYLRNFNVNSEEYETLVRGIAELEKAV